MDMREAIRLAAEQAYAAAHNPRLGEEVKYEGQVEFRNKLSIENFITSAISPTPERTLDLLFQSGVKELASDRLGHIEPDEYEFKLAQLRRLCKEKIKEIDQMLQHRCEFDDNDYCMTCGLDGRA
jgi:hypothetical protein